MNKIIALLLLSPLASFAIADDEKGFFLGGGAMATVNDDCGSYCDSSGYALEAGYYFNKFIGIEAKIGKSEKDRDSTEESELTYFGANIGHSFNTSWVRLYGKVGYVDVKDTDTYWNYSDSDSNATLGIGILFTPFAHQSSFYIKVESISAVIFDDTVSFGQFAVGYQF